MLKDEIESLIRKGKLANYKHYGDQHEEGVKERERVCYYSLRQREMSDRASQGE